MAVRQNPFIQRERMMAAQRKPSTKAKIGTSLMVAKLGGKAMKPLLDSVGKTDAYRNIALDNGWLPATSGDKYVRDMGWGELNSYKDGKLVADPTKYNAMLDRNGEAMRAGEERIAAEYRLNNPESGFSEGPGYSFNAESGAYEPNAAMQDKWANVQPGDTKTYYMQDGSVNPNYGEPATSEIISPINNNYANAGIVSAEAPAVGDVSTSGLSYGNLADPMANVSAMYEPSNFFSGLGSSAGAESFAAGLPSTWTADTVGNVMSDTGGYLFSNTAADLGYSSGFAAASPAAAGAVAEGTAAPVSFDWMGSGAIGSGVMGGAASVASDLLAGKSVNIGKAATTGAGAYAGATIGTAVGGPVGTVVGSVLGSTVGSIVGGGSVICTELHRQGYMSDQLMELDESFGRLQDKATVAGYHYWGKPLAKHMSEHKWVTKLVAPFVMSWAYTMAAKLCPLEYKPRLLGTCMMAIGKPICKFIGKRILDKQNKPEAK